MRSEVVEIAGLRIKIQVNGVLQEFGPGWKHLFAFIYIGCGFRAGTDLCRIQEFDNDFTFCIRSFIMNLVPLSFVSPSFLNRVALVFTPRFFLTEPIPNPSQRRPFLQHDVIRRERSGIPVSFSGNCSVPVKPGH